MKIITGIELNGKSITLHLDSEESVTMRSGEFWSLIDRSGAINTLLRRGLPGLRFDGERIFEPETPCNREGLLEVARDMESGMPTAHVDSDLQAAFIREIRQYPDKSPQQIQG